MTSKVPLPAVFSRRICAVSGIGNQQPSLNRLAHYRYTQFGEAEESP
jgi:hypothetical protein